LSNSELSGGGRSAALRERCPALYQEVLCRYEQAVKLVLQHRVYKINEDAFEPCRQIARQLFVANATARDAVELHYQTLRKITSTADSGKAQAYLEVGRTTIIGLLGDLLMYYRDAHSGGTENSISAAPSAVSGPERDHE
jgi:hypothetical protein